MAFSSRVCSGFTLVELIIVITLTGVVAVLASTLVGNQMQGYVDTARRTGLTARADAALRHIARDLRNAVPYSIRVSGTALEWVPIQSFGRYRQFQSAGSGDPLDFTAQDGSFDVFGAVPSVNAGTQLVIGSTNINAAGFSLYQDASDGALLPLGSHVITPTSTAVTAASGGMLLSTPFQFSQDSAASRFYAINGAASYLCNAGSGVISRFSGYALQASQPVNALVSPLSSATSATLVDSVSACQFGYTALDLQNGLITVRLTLTEEGESVSLVRFIHVENQS